MGHFQGPLEETVSSLHQDYVGLRGVLAVGCARLTLPVFALLAFTSVPLLVSTIWLGITYSFAAVSSQLELGVLWLHSHIWMAHYYCSGVLLSRFHSHRLKSLAPQAWSLGLVTDNPKESTRSRRQSRERKHSIQCEALTLLCFARCF